MARPTGERAGLIQRLRWHLRQQAGMMDVERRFAEAESGGWTAKPHGLDRRLIVSLTSWPRRFHVLPHTLKALLFQTVRPDAVVLWIARHQIAMVPPEVRAFERFGLEIRPCDDLRSFNKIVPAIAAFPDAYIVTADDDTWYWRTWLEELTANRAFTGAPCIGQLSNIIALDAAGLPAPYMDWMDPIARPARGPLVFPLGVLGILHDPQSFHPDVTRADLITSLCPTADDIWLWFMHRLAGNEVLGLATRHRITAWPGSQPEGLWHGNLQGGGNDRAFAALVEHYGFPGG